MRADSAFAHALLHLIKQAPSCVQLIDCDRGPPLYDLGCDGGDFEGGIRYIAENGVDLESDYPYLAIEGACRCATGHAS